MPSEVRGYKEGVTGEFSYMYKAPETGRYLVVVDNRDHPQGTDTEGPVDYTISIVNYPYSGGDPDYPWERILEQMWPSTGLLIVFVALVAMFNLLRWRWKQ